MEDSGDAVLQETLTRNTTVHKLQCVSVLHEMLCLMCCVQHAQREERSSGARRSDQTHPAAQAHVRASSVYELLADVLCSLNENDIADAGGVAPAEAFTHL
jgi:hypothetical protein